MPVALTVPKVYLGDGAYASFDGFHIVVTAEDGICATDTVYMDPYVVKALRVYMDRVDEFMRSGGGRGASEEQPGD